jgi:hypothetical protein
MAREPAPPLLDPAGATGRAQTRAALWATAATGTASTLVFTVGLGWTGLWSGLAATAIVVGFFLAGLTPIRLSGAMGEKAGIGLVLLLTTYAFRLAVAVLLLNRLGSSGHLSGDAVGFTIVFGAVAWTLGQAWVGLRRHDPLDIADHRQDDPTAEVAPPAAIDPSRPVAG